MDKEKNETFYGYKAHAKCGVLSKVIYEVFTTTASTNDSKVIIPLLEWRDFDKKLYLDAGYYGAESLEKIISDYRIEPIICERAFRGHPLTEEQKQSNRVKSKKRCRIEHVFGFIEQSMKGFIARTIGLKRAENSNYLTCAVYNISRCLQLMLNPPEWHIPLEDE